MEKEIPAFLEDRLDNRRLGAFLEHLEGCKSCQDELSVQFLVAEGMNKLETGETFNLQKELKSYVEQERRHLYGREHLTLIAYSLELITLLAVAATVFVAVYILL